MMTNCPLDVANDYGKASASRPASCGMVSQADYLRSLQRMRESRAREDFCTEDPRLANWYRWLQVRLEDQERVRRLTSGRGQARLPQDLVVNSGDDRRTVLEDKQLLEEARGFYRPDKYRGDPAFWQLPYMLSDQGDPCLPACTAAPRRPLPRQFSAVPAAVRPPPQDRSALRRWQQIQYRKLREEQLSDAVSQLAPHRPDLHGLYLKGSPVDLDQTQSAEAPVITVTPPPLGVVCREAEEDGSLTEAPAESDQGTVVRLLVQDELLQKAAPGEQPRQFLLCFQVDVGDTDRKSLRVENVGDTAIRFSWLRLGGAGHPTACFVLESEGGGGPAVFLPGQIYGARFAFRAKRPGVFREQWRLRTTPSLPAVQLRLWGVCRAPPQPVEAVERYLDQRVAQDAARCLLLEAAQRVRLVQPPPPPLEQLCAERELFQTQNAPHGYFYHAAPAADLQRLYRQVAEPDRPSCHLDVPAVREAVLAGLTGDELEEALRTVWHSCDELRAPLPEPSPSAACPSMQRAAVRAAWGLVAEAVAQEADRLRSVWGLPQIQAGHFWQPPEQKGSAKPSDRSVTSGRKGAARQTSPPPPPPLEAESLGLSGPEAERAYLAALFLRARHHVDTAVDWATAALESCASITPSPCI